MTDAERTQLVESHRGRAARVAAKIGRRLPRRVAYDDLEAAAYAGLWDAALRYDPARGEFWSLAYRRVRGAVFDWLREVGHDQRRRKHPLRTFSLYAVRRWAAVRNGIPPDHAEAEPDLIEADPRPPGSDQVDAEDAVAVALRALSPRDARIVALYYLGGRTAKEAGAEVGLTENGTYFALRGILARMRERLLLRDKE